MPTLALIGSILSAGKKPQVPDWKDVSLTEAQQQAQRDNKAMLPEYKDIASDVNKFNFDEIERMVRLATPGYDQIQSQVFNNLQSGLRGEPTREVQDLVARKAAERSVAGGFAGSGMHHSLEARDLGLTSMQIADRAMNSADRWLAQARAHIAGMPMMDVTSMFQTPTQRFQANWQNQEAQFNRQWMKNKIDAMPDPTKAAIGQWMVATDNAVFGTALGVVGSVAGGMLGGVMGGGGGGGGNANTSPYSSLMKGSSAPSMPQASPDWKFELT